MNHPPPVLPEWLQRTAHLVLRASADPAPPGERQPVPRPDTERHRDGQEQQHHRAIELGASEFLTKPFSPKKLYARAAELVGIGGEETGADAT